jgi:hypothetical protein
MPPRFVHFIFEYKIYDRVSIALLATHFFDISLIALKLSTSTLHVTPMLVFGKLSGSALYIIERNGHKAPLINPNIHRVFRTLPMIVHMPK